MVKLFLQYYKKMKLQVPEWLRRCWQGVVWRENSDEKTIYLTFDDGPIPEVTPKVLEILDRYDVKATFFCVGENVMKYPDMYNEVLKRGHQTGNHTFNHIKGFNFSPEEYLENTDKAAQYIDSKLMRPPHGQIKPNQIRLLSPKYKIIMWDVLTYDYDKNFTPEGIIKIIRSKSRNGSIVVFHDSLKAEKNTLPALPQALEFWRNEGYQFKTLNY